MVITCEIILDLLPLYASGSCGETSRKLVEAHVAECPRCATALQRMTDARVSLGDKMGPAYLTEKAYKKAKRRLFIKRAISWLGFTLPLLLALLLIWGWLESMLSLQLN